MKPTHFRKRLRRARAQRGLSLITTLLFMVAALVLGVSVMGVNVMQERIIGNTRDRDFALQAAEAALRDAEQDVSVNRPDRSAFSATCVAGLCIPPTQRSPLPATAALPVDKQPGFDWATTANVRTYGQFTAAAALPGVSQAPVYVVEMLGNLGPTGSVVLGTPPTGAGYRITVRASGARAETVVFLQSIYATR